MQTAKPVAMDTEDSRIQTSVMILFFKVRNNELANSIQTGNANWIEKAVMINNWPELGSFTRVHVYLLTREPPEWMNDVTS